MPGNKKCEPGCTCKKHRRTEEHKRKLAEAHRNRNYENLRCRPGCQCGHHSRVVEPCASGCTCKKHAPHTEEHRRRNSEGMRRAMAEGRFNTPEQHAKGVATRKARGVYLTSEQIEAMQEGRRAALAAGLIKPGSYIDGRSEHQHYERWYNMMQRCTNPRNPMWDSYGGRGIGVCEEWFDPHIFYEYLDTVLGACPPNHSIDRIDNDGNYEPGNIRWASASEQNSNRRRYRHLQ